MGLWRPLSGSTRTGHNFRIKLKHKLENDIMAEVSESAESQQKLNLLKGRMLALKEHL